MSAALVQACRIAKLFAKHMKVAEQQTHLQQHPLCIAAGTPNRLCKLADLEALQLSQLRLIVLDVHQDAKKRCVLSSLQHTICFPACFFPCHHIYGCDHQDVQ